MKLFKATYAGNIQDETRDARQIVKCILKTLIPYPSPVGEGQRNLRCP